jgi:hypothetical protein
MRSGPRSGRIKPSFRGFFRDEVFDRVLSMPQLRKVTLGCSVYVKKDK